MKNSGRTGTKCSVDCVGGVAISACTMLLRASVVLFMLGGAARADVVTRLYHGVDAIFMHFNLTGDPGIVPNVSKERIGAQAAAHLKEELRDHRYGVLIFWQWEGGTLHPSVLEGGTMITDININVERVRNGWGPDQDAVLGAIGMRFGRCIDIQGSFAIPPEPFAASKDGELVEQRAIDALNRALTRHIVGGFMKSFLKSPGGRSVR